MKRLIVQTITCLALVAVSIYAAAQDVATKEEADAYKAKVTAVAPTAAEVIPAKTLDTVQITDLSIVLGTKPEDISVHFAWAKGTVVNGEFVAATSDSVTMTYADLKGVDVAKFVEALTAVAKAKGKL